MAGNRAIYDQLMQTGSARAWEKRWDEAVAAYEKALAEFPDDLQALTALGLALAEGGQLERALLTFQQAAKVDPDSPTLPEQIGAILEKMGQGRQAALAYVAAADRHIRRQNANLAIRQWKEALRCDPNCVSAHVNLLKVYLTQRKTAEALEEYLALAGIYHSQGRTEQALQIAQLALKLDPLDSRAQVLLVRLQGGGLTEPQPEADMAELTFTAEVPEGGGEEGGSPVETARLKALANLAETVFSDMPHQTSTLAVLPMSKAEVDALITKALDAQTRGNVDEAIACYEDVLRAGVIQPAANFNLGLLYQQRLRFEEAIAQFQKSVEQPEYRLGSHFALGECYRALGRIGQARAEFIEVLKIVDLGTVDREQADDLIQLYEELARTHAAAGEGEQATEFVNSLVAFLSEKGWEDKALQARERLDALTSKGPVLSLAEILATPDSERILQAIGLAQEYQRHNKMYAAMDELNRALSLAPYLLPIHWQMGETLASMGRLDKAVAKFLIIAEAYHVRGNLLQSAAMYERVLRLDPMNLQVRARLIEMLISHGEIDRALEHYLVLGNAYYQMAQLDRAREQYTKALQLAPRGSAEQNWAVRLLHRIGDIDLQRLDWRRAMAAYEQIRTLAPDDEKARLTLVDLYSRFNQPAKAIAELDGLLQAYRQSGKTQKILTILQEQVQEHPDSIPLRARLAQACLDARDIPAALQHLDTLGDLQIEAGHMKEAIATIKVILRLNPHNADAYRQVLAQLTGGQEAG